MFERIKCYRNLKKADKALQGALKLGEIINDTDLISQSMDALTVNAQIRTEMWHNRKMAKEYNSKVTKVLGI
mgnify:FL=1